jgi:histidine triad (HIT) family protein
VLPRLCRAVQQATRTTDYNILQNNGAPAHQAVFHVHFHIIPQIAGRGLGLKWNAGQLGPGQAKDLLARMQTTLVS